MKPTSRTRKPRAVKEEATRLASVIVRWTKGPGCQVPHCPRGATDCAHIVGRSYSHTRTDIDNCFALCAQCHRHFTNWQGDWMSFVDQTIGRPEYDRLVRKARAGIGVKFDWYDELDRLRALAAELGVAA
jgi:hypothetical protein